VSSNPAASKKDPIADASDLSDFSAWRHRRSFSGVVASHQTIAGTTPSTPTTEAPARPVVKGDLTTKRKKGEAFGAALHTL